MLTTKPGAIRKSPLRTSNRSDRPLSPVISQKKRNYSESSSEFSSRIFCFSSVMAVPLPIARIKAVPLFSGSLSGFGFLALTVQRNPVEMSLRSCQRRFLRSFGAKFDHLVKRKPWVCGLCAAKAFFIGLITQKKEDKSIGFEIPSSGHFHLGHPVIPPEFEFMKIALQMLLAQIKGNALLGPLKQRIERLGRMVVHIAPGNLFAAMVNPIMSLVAFADDLISPKLVAYPMRTRINEFADPRFQIRNTVTVFCSGPRLTAAKDCQADLQKRSWPDRMPAFCAAKPCAIFLMNVVCGKGP